MTQRKKGDLKNKNEMNICLKTLLTSKFNKTFIQFTSLSCKFFFADLELSY